MGHIEQLLHLARFHREIFRRPHRHCYGGGVVSHIDANRRAPALHTVHQIALVHSRRAFVHDHEDLIQLIVAVKDQAQADTERFLINEQYTAAVRMTVQFWDRLNHITWPQLPAIERDGAGGSVRLRMCLLGIDDRRDHFVPKQAPGVIGDEA